MNLSPAYANPYYLRIIVSIVVFFVSWCPLQADLIFRSGFEAGTEENLKGDPPRIDRLHGRDLSVSAPNDWEEDLQAGTRNLWFNYVDHTDGVNTEMLGARLGSDPENADNRVFHARQKDAEWQEGGYWSRVQGELTGFDWPEIYYKVRFRLDSAIAVGDQESEEDLGLSLFEVGGEPGFHLCRIVIRKWGSKRSWSDGKSPLTWRAEVRTPKKNHTLYESAGIRPKYEVWQTLEFYAKAGDTHTGRYWVAIDGEVLFDTTVTTKDSGNWTFAGILKVYCGSLTKFLAARGEMVDVWFDDIEIWNSFPYAPAEVPSAGSITYKPHQSADCAYRLTVSGVGGGPSRYDRSRPAFDLRGRESVLLPDMPTSRQRAVRIKAPRAVIVIHPR